MIRIVSLVPAGTEIVAALGGANLLVGISHECDYPATVQHLPRLTSSSIDPGTNSKGIDAEVRALQDAGRPVLAVDGAMIRQLAPDLILTQDLCEVCAVNEGEVHRVFSAMPESPQVLPLTARDLQGIWSDIRNVGRVLGLEDRAEELLLQLEGRLERLRKNRPATKPRVLCLEWLDPPYLAGHWVPDLVAAAGGHDLAARSGSHSTRRSWAELTTLRPDCLLVMLCGFGVDRARVELENLESADALEFFRRVPTWILDGSSYTSRGGPRVVDGAEQIWSVFAGHAMPGIERWEPAAVC
jgi:iron complex transport system substrate-binding protein